MELLPPQLWAPAKLGAPAGHWLKATSLFPRFPPIHSFCFQGPRFSLFSFPLRICRLLQPIPSQLPSSLLDFECPYLPSEPQAVFASRPRAGGLSTPEQMLTVFLFVTLKWLEIANLPISKWVTFLISGSSGRTSVDSFLRACLPPSNLHIYRILKTTALWIFTVTKLAFFVNYSSFFFWPLLSLSDPLLPPLSNLG